MKKLTLRDLFKSLMSSVSQAKAHLHDDHIEATKGHFDYDDKKRHWSPKTIDMLLPKSVIEEGEAHEQPVGVPTYTLVSHDPVSFEEINLELSCNFEQVQEDKSGNFDMIISLDNPESTKSHKIDISFKMSSKDPTEGNARLNDALVKKIQ